MVRYKKKVSQMRRKSERVWKYGDNCDIEKETDRQTDRWNKRNMSKVIHATFFNKVIIDDYKKKKKKNLRFILPLNWLLCEVCMHDYFTECKGVFLIKKIVNSCTH